MPSRRRKQLRTTQCHRHHQHRRLRHHRRRRRRQHLHYLYIHHHLHRRQTAVPATPIAKSRVGTGIIKKMCAGTPQSSGPSSSGLQVLIIGASKSRACRFHRDTHTSCGVAEAVDGGALNPRSRYKVVVKRRKAGGHNAVYMSLK